ncbi:MAG: DUF721 domain-containing protein [Treponemataceae bacterium]|nr:DUF721 domain-containing protein [Treponemataceae bacterium]
MNSNFDDEYQNGTFDSKYSTDVSFRRSDEILRYDVMMSSLFSNIDAKKMQESIAVSKGWKEIVETISTNPAEKNRTGILLAAHSKVVDLKNDILLVETDHPGYIQLMQNYKTYILRGLKMKYPQLNVKNICFKLKNTDVKIPDYQEEIRPAVNAEEENAAKSKMEVDEKLPPELRDKFEKLKNSLLTNN